MKLKELFAAIKTDPAFKGFVTTDQMVIAIDISEKQDADVDDFEVAYMGFTDKSSSLNAEEKTNSYYYHGKSTTKTGNQRTIDFKADRYIGDAFQDFAFSFDMKYAKGQKSVVRYAYFNMLTGEGEIGSATLIVSDDGSGAPEENLSVSASLKKNGAEPEKLMYEGFMGYESVKQQPADWTSKYKEYLERKGGRFANITAEAAPKWEEGKYYSRKSA